MNTSEFLEYLETEKGYSANTMLAYKADVNQFAECMKRECEVTNEKDVTSSMIGLWMQVWHMWQVSFSIRMEAARIQCV